MKKVLLFFALELSTIGANAGNPMLDVVFLEACGELSPALGQSYSDWLQRQGSDFKETLEQARQLPEYSTWKQDLAGRFKKIDESTLVQACTVKFDAEIRPKNTVRGMSAATTEKNSLPK